MNSVKNAIVTMTLLAVGYGAYVVLNNPAPTDSADPLAGVDWNQPDVMIPNSEAPLSEIPAVDAPASEPLLELPSTATSATPHDAELALSGTQPPPLDLGPGDDGGQFATAATAASNFYSEQAATDDQQAPASNAYPSTATPAFPGPSHDVVGGQPESGFLTTWRSVQDDLQQGQLANALVSLSAWYESPLLNVEQQEMAQPLLDQLAGTVIYSNESYIEPVHVVAAGETLDSLSRQYSVPAPFLARINGLDPAGPLTPGESLKVVRGPFRAEVNPAGGHVTLFLGRYYAGRFNARFGADLPPGEPVLEVVSIEGGREFFDPDTGRRFGRDDPDNPFGGRWIALRGDQITGGDNVGIHVDTGDSHRCCIGVSPVDANDLSAILSIGSRVRLVR